MKACILLTLFLLLGNSPTLADIYRYTDDEGRSHYVTNKNEVPEQYSDQLRDASPLPKISRNSSPDWQYRPPSPKAHRSEKPVVLVMKGCGFCRALENLLQENRIPYKRLDIHNDREGTALYNQFGGGGVPMTIVGKRMIQGYRPNEILDLLKKK